MVVDAAGSRVIMWEGTGTWQLSLDAEPEWSPVLLTGPKPPTGASSIFDPVRNRMLIFGNSVIHWLDLSAPTSWATLTTTGSPPLWDLAAAVYDPVRDRVLAWDGSAAKGVWQLTLAGTPAWSQVATSGTPPPYRFRPRTLYDPALDRLLVCGGVGVIDAWQLTLSGSPTWSSLAPQGPTPPARADASCVLDVLRNRVLLFGGGLPGVDVLSLTGTPTWGGLAPVGTETPLTTTTLMGAIYDASHDRVLTYGGLDATVHQGTAFELAFEGLVDAPRSGPARGSLRFTRAAPDPASGRQHLEWNRPVGEGARLEVYSLSGRRAWSRALPAAASRVDWDGRGYDGRPVAPGVYFARLLDREGVATLRIVRLR
jgi:hypothetical protein